MPKVKPIDPGASTLQRTRTRGSIRKNIEVAISESPVTIPSYTARHLERWNNSRNGNS